MATQFPWGKLLLSTFGSTHNFFQPIVSRFLTIHARSSHGHRICDNERLLSSQATALEAQADTTPATVPTPEETYAAMAPDLRRKVDANRAARLARENATKQQETAQLNDPDAQKPIWADSSRS
ncbi:hypothetical protein ONZ51_g6568 [Trametes cubensis]|uniref:Uncharacterized protein n=1 Tax=Trametes cubensis TaxID=1111947 RepID=A0AAD7TU97_9APHY|nr:hypothetical protein ONZ51_g6568 [Trametes cubensis]